MGVWSSFVDWIAWCVEKLYGFTVDLHIGSYALAIIILTAIVKLALYPLSRSQLRATRKMQELQPQIDEIRRKYKNKDPQRMNQLTMELYKENNASPFAGCLPLLVQFPVLIGLYQALINFNYVNAADAGFFWIPSLSQTDPYYILPVMAGVFTYFQSKVSTTNPEDRTQKIMLIMMPIMIVWISATVPSGMSIYWVTFSVAGIIQQVYVNRKVEKEAFAEAEAALAAAEESGDARELKKATKRMEQLEEKRAKRASQGLLGIGGQKSEETAKPKNKENQSSTKGGTKSGTKKNNGSPKKGKK